MTRRERGTGPPRWVGEAVALYADGFSLRDIGELFDTDLGMVRYWLLGAGVQMRPRGCAPVRERP